MTTLAFGSKFRAERTPKHRWRHGCALQPIAFLNYRRVHLEEKNIETIPHSLDECGMVNRKTIFLTVLSPCEHNHKHAQSKLSAQAAQFVVRMRKRRHLGLMGTETPLGQTSVERCLICRMITCH